MGINVGFVLKIRGGGASKNVQTEKFKKEKIILQNLLIFFCESCIITMSNCGKEISFMSKVLKAFPFSVADKLVTFVLCLVFYVLLGVAAAFLICLVQCIGALAVVMGVLLAIYALAGLVVTLLLWFGKDSGKAAA